MRSLIVFVLLAASAAPAAAQVALGAELGPESFIRGDEAALDTLSEESFAWALSVEVSSSVLYSVFESTAPEEAITKYLRRGIYRQELTAMLLLSEEKGVPFKKLAEELPKAGSFAALAGRYKADAMALFAAGGRLKDDADVRVPLFLTGPAFPDGGVPVSAGAVDGAPELSSAPAAGKVK